MNIVVARTAAQWRAWLSENCRSEKEVWLVIHHKDSGRPSIRYHEAIEQALCTDGSTACTAHTGVPPEMWTPIPMRRWPA